MAILLIVLVLMIVLSGPVIVVAASFLFASRRNLRVRGRALPSDDD